MESAHDDFLYMPSVLIIDSNWLARQGLKDILSQEYLGVIFTEAHNGKEGLIQARMRSWDLIVVDLTIPAEDGFFLLGSIRNFHPATPVLAMSSQTDLRHAARAEALGATGYTGKDVTNPYLLRAIRDVLSGKKHFPGFRLPDDARIFLPRLKDLSPRERHVMLALASGRRPTDIAAELNLSIKTVSTYKGRLLRKLKVGSIAELVRLLIDHNVY